MNLEFVRLDQVDWGQFREKEGRIRIPGPKREGVGVCILGFGRGLAGEEGGAAVGVRQPPSSPMKLGRRWVVSLAER